MQEQRIYGIKELGTQGSGGEKIIEGHAAVFGQYTQIGDSFIEVIERGAFDGCDLADVALFVNHQQSSIPLARTVSGTMTLTVDNIGLAIRARLDVENNRSAKELYSAVERGDLKAMSFAFTTADDDWDNLNSDMPTRRVKKIARVFEVSACTYPAYEGTDLYARGKDTLKAARKKSASNATEIERLKKNIKEFAMDKNSTSEARTRYETAGEKLRDRDIPVRSPYNVFGELRTMTVNPPSSAAASTIAVPTFSATSIEPTFPMVSSLIDAVTHVSFNGGESYNAPFVLGFDEAYYTDEAAEAALIDAQFGYAELNKCKITAYAELSRELEKLPSANYADMIFQIVRTSIRKALTKEILFGQGINDAGDRYRIVGICSDKATAINSTTDVAVSQITDTLLDEILLAYGGDTDIETPATLVLSKQDLMAFSRVRSSVKSKIYEIVYTSGNTGRISGVPFIIDSNLKPLSDASTASGEYCMIYGNPKNYTLVEFSPLTVKKSVHYKFPRGLVCFRGSAVVAGNVTKKDGFLRIRKS